MSDTNSSSTGRFPFSQLANNRAHKHNHTAYGERLVHSQQLFSRQSNLFTRNGHILTHAEFVYVHEISHLAVVA